MGARKLALLLALTAGASMHATAGLAQIQPNSTFFAVSDYYYPGQNGDLVRYQVSGFAQPPAPNIQPALFILPTITVRPSDIRYFRPNGTQVDPRVFPNAEIGSVTITPRLVNTMPTAAQAPAIAAVLEGQSMEGFYAPSWKSDGQPAMTPEAAAYLPAREVILADYKAYDERVAGQAAVAAKYAAYTPRTATLNQVEIHLMIGGEKAASKTLPGYLGGSSSLGQINILAPSEFQKNQLLEGSFELLVTSRFPDARTSYIQARFDARQAVDSFVEETQKALTKSKSSGFQVFHIGSRRSKMSTSINQSLRTNDQLQVMQNTNVVMFDATDEMIKQFEEAFFPELAKEEVIDRHLAAAAAASQAGNLELARIHQDYAQAIRASNELAEVDAVAAAAALNAGDYAGFVANGVRSINSNDRRANNFRRVETRQAVIEQATNWNQTRQVTVQREVSVPVLIDAETPRAPRVGLCGMRINVPYLWFRNNGYGYPVSEQRQALMVTCVQDSSPLAAAGVAPGSMLLAVGPRNVATMQEFETELTAFDPGDTAPFWLLKTPGAGQPFSSQRRANVVVKKGLPRPQAD